MARLIEIVQKAPKTFGAMLTLRTVPEEVKIKFNCKYRSQSEVKDWLDSVGERKLSNEAMVMEAAEGWDLEDEFTPEAVAHLLDVFHCFPAVMDMYYAGLYGQREKN